MSATSSQVHPMSLFTTRLPASACDLGADSHLDMVTACVLFGTPLGLTCTACCFDYHGTALQIAFSCSRTSFWKSSNAR